MNAVVRKIGAIITLAFMFYLALNIYKEFTLCRITPGFYCTVLLILNAIIPVTIAHIITPTHPLLVATIMLIITIEHQIIELAFSVSIYAGVGLFEAIIEVVSGEFDWYRFSVPLLFGVAASIALRQLTIFLSRNHADNVST